MKRLKFKVMYKTLVSRNYLPQWGFWFNKQNQNIKNETQGKRLPYGFDIYKCVQVKREFQTISRNP